MGDIQCAAEDHIPYRYQEEVFQQAQRENIIAALSTGSGKTLISILLIKWIASQSESSGKIIVFLVPRVTLVDQQCQTIRRHTSLKVDKLHGAMELELGNRAGWKKKLESQHVFVMTAQIFLNLITHGLWSIKRVSLMIFDECHHTRGNHPYNNILREYHQLAQSDRPKVFGMTASPIWNNSKAEASILELERSMDSKIMGVRENLTELKSKTPKPHELVETYPPPAEDYDCPLVYLYQGLQIISSSTWDDLDIPFDTLSKRYQTTCNNTGPFTAALFLYLELKRHLLLLDQDEVDGENTMQGILPLTPVKSPPEELPLIRAIVDDFRHFFPPDGYSHEIPVAVPLEWCTPKVRCLVDILLNFHSQSSSFQCIIFVEQRQVASTLSKTLLAIPETSGKLRTAYLVGEGVNSEGVARESDRVHGDPVALFREGHINVLIATSVAEEGLDFRECDLVIRFDGIQHMVGYVQSRGRARKKGSTFIIMVREDDETQLAKYYALKTSEEAMTSLYRSRHPSASGVDPNEDDDEDFDTEGFALDLVDRERYVVPSSGAVLTYDNSLNLVGRLCALIPHDSFTPPYTPKYEGDFEFTLRLPAALPLAPEDLIFRGPRKNTKREAKRAVAFMAVVRLRELDVFDEYLLPVGSQEGDFDAPSLGDRTKQTIAAPVTLKVDLRDPWYIGSDLWLHPVVIGERTVAGLVTGTSLPPCEVLYQGRVVRICPGKLLRMDLETRHEQRKMMEEFTKRCIAYSVTASPFESSLSLYLVPITPDNLPNFEEIRFLLEHPKGIRDWDAVPQDRQEYMLMCIYRGMSMCLIHNIRDDLSPLSIPPEGSREYPSPTFREHWEQKWSKRHKNLSISPDGPLVECWHLPRLEDSTYALNPSEDDHRPVHSAPQGRLYPLNECVWIPVSSNVRHAYEALPALAQRITHVYRASCALREMQLPPIPLNLIIEAFTIPSASFPFNNQRLETLGDAVLQVCSTVHLLHRYPNRHEGQLTDLRQSIVSNRYLLHRALDNGLERYVNCETPGVHRWRYVLDGDDDLSGVPRRFATREYPRRSLQDCMEAILATAFLAGGIEMALQVGAKLGLEFGGPLPWFLRYKQPAIGGALPPLMGGLEESLGYRFQNVHVLREAITHPSSASRMTGDDTPSYQRLEFLGDAILDLVVAKYLYDKFPEATSHQLSIARARAICSPTLAYLAVSRLQLHKMTLIDSFELLRAISRYVTIFETISAAQVVEETWKYDPPKPLCDVFESVIGAVLVDSGYNYEKTAAVVEYVMEDALEVLSPATAKDPVSQLTEWCTIKGCLKLAFEKQKRENTTRHGIAVLVHGTVIVGPVTLSSLSSAKFAAAERALTILQDSASPYSLARLCVCASERETAQENIDSQAIHACLGPGLLTEPGDLISYSVVRFCQQNWCKEDPDLNKLMIRIKYLEN